MKEFFESSLYKNIVAKVTGFGASLVIIGCFFKIQHYEGAGLMLGIGLTVEAIIFALSAMEPIHEEVDWTIVYPELAGIVDDDEELNKIFYNKDKPLKLNKDRADAANSELETLASTGKLSSDQYEKLKNGIERLSESANNISDLSQVSQASNKLSGKLDVASQTTDKFNEVLALDIKKHVDLSDEFKVLSQDVNSKKQMISSNYEKLNESIVSSYEAYNTLSYNISTTAGYYSERNGKLGKGIDMAESIDQHEKDMIDNVKHLKEEMESLQNKLASLNDVYNNMLSTVNGAVAKKVS